MMNRPLSQILLLFEELARTRRKVAEPEQVMEVAAVIEDADGPVSDSANVIEAISPLEQAAVVPLEENRKNVRIVPLSEAHKPMQDRDLGLDPAASAKKPPRPKRRLPSLELLDPPKSQSGGWIFRVRAGSDVPVAGGETEGFQRCR